jgi:hypothetical protein
MADETYVSHDGWTHQVGRSDQIDEIADQFERRTADAVVETRVLEPAGR